MEEANHAGQRQGSRAFGFFGVSALAINEKEQYIALLEERLRLAQIRRLGASSEKIPGQGNLKYPWNTMSAGALDSATDARNDGVESTLDAQNSGIEAVIGTRNGGVETNMSCCAQSQHP